MRPGATDEDVIAISLHACAYGYGEIAEHPEQIFTSGGRAEKTAVIVGGRVAILTSSGPDACAEIHLASVIDAAHG